MAKNKTAYVCNECGQDFPRWQGQCNACQEWNTITEVRLGASTATRTHEFSGYAGETSKKVQTLDQIDLNELPRIASTFGELDRVLGGGIVPGSAILIGGNPGRGLPQEHRHQPGSRRGRGLPQGSELGHAIRQARRAPGCG